MAFNNFNRNKNTNNRVNTSSKIAQLYNENAGDDSSTLRMSLWNDLVSIQINPILPKSERTNEKVYNYEQTAGVLLNMDNIVQLRTGIKILEASYKDKESKKVNNIAVEGLQGVICKIGGAGEYEGIDNFYIELINMTNGQVDGQVFFVFGDARTSLMVNFDEDEGNFKKRNVNVSWETFKQFIEYAYENLINGSCHAVNKNLDYHMNRVSQTLETIKALIENLVTGNGGSVESSSNSSFNKSGFNSTRRRRNAIKLDDDLNDDGDDAEDFVNVPDDIEEEEVEFDKLPTKKSSKKSTKKSTSSSSTKKSTSKKSSKKIALDEIAADMEDDLDDMSDLD